MKSCGYKAITICIALILFCMGGFTELAFADDVDKILGMLKDTDVGKGRISYIYEPVFVSKSDPTNDANFAKIWNPKPDISITRLARELSVNGTSAVIMGSGFIASGARLSDKSSLKFPPVWIAGPSIGKFVLVAHRFYNWPIGLTPPQRLEPVAVTWSVLPVEQLQFAETNAGHPLDLQGEVAVVDVDYALSGIFERELEPDQALGIVQGARGPETILVGIYGFNTTQQQGEIIRGLQQGFANHPDAAIDFSRKISFPELPPVARPAGPIKPKIQN